MKIAFFKGRHPGLKGLFGVLVKWWTRGDFSHVELVADGPDATGLSTCWSSTFLDGGVRKASIDLSTSDWVVVDLPVTAAERAAAIEWFDSHKGQPYDVRGLFGFVIRRVPGERGRWFCNESIGAALGIPEPWRFDPNSFYSMIAGMTPMIQTPQVAA